MGKRITTSKWGGFGDNETWTSEREYAEFDVAATEEVQHPWGGFPVKQALTLAVYVDMGTGLVTNDPEAFEKWLKEKRLNG